MAILQSWSDASGKDPGAIVALPFCASGPGSSCPLDEILALVRKRDGEITDFKEVCGIGDEAADTVTVLHQ